MAKLKTTQTEQSVEEFLNTVEDESKRKDSFVILELMRRITGVEPKMWGPSIVGFGEYHYKYASGHEGDAARVGFSPRKQNLTLYILGGFENYEQLLSKLGKHSIGKSCLYIKRVADISLPVLEEMVKQSYQLPR